MLLWLGDTHFHYVCPFASRDKGKAAEIAFMLLQHGAGKTFRKPSNFGKRPLESAKENGFKIVERLISDYLSKQIKSS